MRATTSILSVFTSVLLAAPTILPAQPTGATAPNEPMVLRVRDAMTGLAVPEGVTLTELAKGEDHDLSVVSIHARRAVEEPTEAPEAEGGAAEGEAEGGAGEEG